MVSGRVSSDIGGARIPDKPLDLRAGRVFFPLGKRIVRGCNGDEVRGLGVWIETREAP